MMSEADELVARVRALVWSTHQLHSEKPRQPFLKIEVSEVDGHDPWSVTSVGESGSGPTLEIALTELVERLSAAIRATLQSRREILERQLAELARAEEITHQSPKSEPGRGNPGQ